MPPRKPIAVYHEHPDWFRPLFAEPDRRGGVQGTFHTLGWLAHLDRLGVPVVKRPGRVHGRDQQGPGN